MEVISRKKGRPPHAPKMSVAERESLIEQNRHREDQLDKSLSHMIQDSGSLKSQLDRTSAVLDKDEDLEAKGREKDRLVSRRKEIADELTKRVPPLWLQKAKPGSAEYSRAIDAGVKANEPIVGKLYDEYKDVSRRLDPDNPSAGSIGEVISK